MKFVATSDEPYFVQVGIVHGSVGKCNDQNIPGIYARVADEEVFNFIQEHLKPSKSQLLSTSINFNL